MTAASPALGTKTSKRRWTDTQIATFQVVPSGNDFVDLFGKGALSSSIQPIGGGRELRCIAAGPALTTDCAVIEAQFGDMVIERICHSPI